MEQVTKKRVIGSFELTLMIISVFAFSYMVSDTSTNNQISEYESQKAGDG